MDITQKRIPIILIIILVCVLIFQYVTNISNTTTLIDSETCELYIKDNQINSKKYLGEYDSRCLDIKNIVPPWDLFFNISNSFILWLLFVFDLNFLSKKVLEYQQKKLVEAEKNLQNHLVKKRQLLKLDLNNDALENEEKMIKIWSNNVEKIKKEIKKLKNTE